MTSKHVLWEAILTLAFNTPRKRLKLLLLSWQAALIILQKAANVVYDSLDTTFPGEEEPDRMEISQPESAEHQAAPLADCPGSAEPQAEALAGRPEAQIAGAEAAPPSGVAVQTLEIVYTALQRLNQEAKDVCGLSSSQDSSEDSGSDL